MATSVPTTRRNWIWIALAILLIVVVLAIIYRKVTGNTVADRRAQAEQEQEKKVLNAATAPNAEGFLRKLEKQEDTARQAAGIEAPQSDKSRPQADGVTQLAGQPPVKTPTSAGGAPAGAVPAQSPANPVTTSRTIGATSQGQGSAMPAGAPTDQQLDQYDALQAQVAKDAARHLGVYEAKASVQAGGASNSPVDSAAAMTNMLKAAIPTAQAQGSAATSTNSQQALIEAYLKQQGMAGAPVPSKDAQFLTSTAAASQSRANQPPLTAKEGLGNQALFQGTKINVMMEDAVSSDLPGSCTARVERDVYDSLTQSKRLIPAGTRLICEYNNEVVMGQSRIMLAFTRMIFPVTGASVWLADMRAADTQGRAGAPAQVNTHFWKIFGSSFLIAWVANRAQSLQPSNITINVGGQGGGNTAAQVLSETSRQILQRNINIKPELTLKPGDRLTLVISRDMVLDASVTGVR